MNPTFSSISATDVMLKNFDMLANLPERTRVRKMNEQGLLEPDLRYAKWLVRWDTWKDGFDILERDFTTARTFTTDQMELKKRVDSAFILAIRGLERLSQTYIYSAKKEPIVAFAFLVDRVRASSIYQIKNSCSVHEILHEKRQEELCLSRRIEPASIKGDTPPSENSGPLIAKERTSLESPLIASSPLSVKLLVPRPVEPEILPPLPPLPQKAVIQEVPIRPAVQVMEEGRGSCCLQFLNRGGSI